MRTLGILICSFISMGFSFGLAAGGSASDQPERVQLAVTTVAVRSSFDVRSDVLLLWNRDLRSRPIGSGVKSCVRVSGGNSGIIGGGLYNCVLSLVLPLGKIQAAGVVHDLRRYTIVITGGTGAYVHASGPLVVVKHPGSDVRSLTFTVN